MIQVRSLSKRFLLYGRPADRLRDWAIPWNRAASEFWALRDVTLSLPRGASVGIVGANGSGKSTLLKILAGAMKPTAGEARVEGRVGALLELGVGFHPEFTGRQNALLNALLLGLPREEALRRMPEVWAFSELGDFFDQPLRTYSSGMVVRLGFAAAACLDPEILVIDEALAVGDAWFQQKCLQRLRRFQENGATILFVSHDPLMIKSLCSEACLLDAGELVDRGSPDDVLDHYNARIARKAAQGRQAFSIVRGGDAASAPSFHGAAQRSGNFLGVIRSVALLNDTGATVEAVPIGARATIRVEALALETLPAPTIGILVRDRAGNDVYGTNTLRLGEELPALGAGEVAGIDFHLEMNLGPGRYTVAAAIHAGDSHHIECYDWADRTLVFEMLPTAGVNFLGIADLRAALHCDRSRAAPPDLDETLARLFGDAPDPLPMGLEFQKAFLKGWFPPEGEPGKPGRWTGPEALFAFVPRGNGIRIAAWRSADETSPPATVSLFRGGDLLSRRDAPTGESAALEFPISERLRLRPSIFRLSVDPPWIPSSSGIPDDRALGVYVERIESFD